MSDEREFDAQEAERRIDAAPELTQQQKANLLKFVRKFPDLRFYTPYANYMGDIYEDLGITLPPLVEYWLLGISGMTVSTDGTVQRAFFNARFWLNSKIETSGFDAAGDLWDVNVGVKIEPEHCEAMLRSEPQLSLYPIALPEQGDDETPWPERYLGVNLIPGDDQVYGYRLSEVIEACAQGRAISTAVSPVFSDITDLLANVCAVVQSVWEDLPAEETSWWETELVDVTQAARPG